MGQHNHLAKFLGAEAEQFSDGSFYVADTGRNDLTVIVLCSRLFPEGGLVRVRVLGYATATLQAFLFRAPGNSKYLFPDLKVQGDLGEQGFVHKVASHLPAVSFFAGGFAIKSEANSIKNGCLPGARGAVNEKQSGPLEVREIQSLFFTIGAKGCEAYLQRSHQALPPSTASMTPAMTFVCLSSIFSPVV